MTSSTPHLIGALADLDDDTTPPPFGDEPALEPEAPARRQLGQRWRVYLDDDTDLEVTTTNRDLIAWERTKARHKEWPSSADAPIFATTFAVWTAARRAGLTPLQFDPFVEAVIELEKLSDVPADPTR